MTPFAEIPPFAYYYSLASDALLAKLEGNRVVCLSPLVNSQGNQLFGSSWEVGATSLNNLVQPVRVKHSDFQIESTVMESAVPEKSFYLFNKLLFAKFDNDVFVFRNSCLQRMPEPSGDIGVSLLESVTLEFERIV